MADDISLRHANEREQRQLLEALFADTSLSVFDMFRNFPVFTPRYNLARFLVHYELFKLVAELPGSLVDLGVFRGASTFTFAKLCEIFCPTDARKMVYGFDTFAGFPEVRAVDGGVDEGLDRKPGGFCGGEGIEHDLERARQAMLPDKHLRHLHRIEFVKGDMCATIPEFVAAKGPGLRLCLLNIDCDLYEPTRVALEHFVPRLVPGGVIILDEYAHEHFGGESQAVEEYFAGRFGKRPRIRKFPWHSVPSGYIVADW